MKVSVVTTVHNGDAYLNQALVSVLEQDHEDLEVCVVLDGCTDHSEDVARDLAARDSRVMVDSLPRIGRGPALRMGVAHTSGSLISIMDADDYAFPDKVRTLVGAFESAAPDVGVIGSCSVFFTDEESPPRRVPPRVGGVRDVTGLLRRANPLMHSSVMVRRSALESVGGYDWRRRSQLDYDLFVRLAAREYRLLELPGFLTGIRRHEGRYFTEGHRVRYRLESLQVQRRAIRGVEGPAIDHLLVPARLVTLAVKQEHLDRLGRIWLRP